MKVKVTGSSIDVCFDYTVGQVYEVIETEIDVDRSVNYYVIDDTGVRNILFGNECEVVE